MPLTAAADTSSVSASAIARPLAAQLGDARPAGTTHQAVRAVAQRGPHQQPPRAQARARRFPPRGARRSSDRSTCTTASKPAAARRCVARSVSPAKAPNAASRAGTSAAELACSVVSPPRWPVLYAVSTSRSSAPRHSPRTMRSGRIRSDSRTSRSSPTAPAPSTFTRRSTRRTTCGCAGLSSPTSSTTTIRSRWSTSPSSVDASVVLPAPVPPVTSRLARARTRPASSDATGGDSIPAAIRSAMENGSARTRRIEIVVHPSATGGSTAWKREPSGNRASHVGAASSNRRPAAAASLTATPRTASGPAKVTGARSQPSPRSTHTSLGPLTRTSVTPGIASSDSRGPASAITAQRWAQGLAKKRARRPDGG